VNLDKIIQAGNEIRIKSEKGGFITSIDEVGGDTLTVIGSLEPAHQLMMKPEEKCLVTCVTERGLYMFETQVIKVHKLQNVILVELRAVSDYRKVQRREAFRAREKLAVGVRAVTQEEEKPAEWINTNTVNISERGVLLRFGEECAAGQLMELVISIDSLGMKETLPPISGKVIRCTETSSRQQGYLLGIEFENLPEKARDTIIKLVVLSQRSKLTYKYIKGYR
jgi:c-di-GMP-binding flagellar brake protein YcgR